MEKGMPESVAAIETVILSNDYGMTVEIINFGARIRSIKFPVKNKLMEMTLGYDAICDYLTDEYYLGATCGRVCNRIAGGKFELDGRYYQLPQNDGENCLHGGVDNYSMRSWKIKRETLTNSIVTLTLISDNGDQGFPGTLDLSVTYQLSADNKLIMTYFANTDLATPINLTNHSYFNLGEKDCLSLNLQIMSSVFLETNAQNIPTGKIVEVDESDFNFRSPVCIGKKQMYTNDESIRLKKGYDHCFILDNAPMVTPKAILTSEKNQVSLSVYTDQAAIQLYTGYYLDGEFSSYQGLCLEAQNYIDAENHSHFPSNVLRENQNYQRQIIYQFQSLIK